MSKKIMSKKQFIKAIGAIKAQHDYDLQFAQHLGRAFPDVFAPMFKPKNHYLQNALIEILQREFKDTGSHSWIEYYLWELDFGKKNDKLKATDSKGNDIPLTSTADLYECLIKFTLPTTTQLKYK